MRRQTIDFGIDLGVDHAVIAVVRGLDTEVVKNHHGQERTPCAVRVDGRGSFIVGQGASERLDDDPGNTFAEFGLRMGTNHEYRFERSGLTMRAEDLSAEVLKSLKMDVIERLGEDIAAAVITVPAAFDAPQTAATRRAAEKAGLAVSPLVLEPLAASLAFGAQALTEDVRWLTYDFGRNRFVVSLVELRDRQTEVLAHAGDHHLGGRLIDWAIVEELFAPELTKEHQLTDFRRGNPQWQGAMAKLRQEAEEARARLRTTDTTEAIITFVCLDDGGKPVGLEVLVSRADVERLMEPYVLRSVELAKGVLAEQRLGPGDIEKVCLIGDATLDPYLRDRLKDPTEGLGVRLDFSADPLTAIARGAAIFAGSWPLEEGASPG